VHGFCFQSGVAVRFGFGGRVIRDGLAQTEVVGLVELFAGRMLRRSQYRWMTSVLSGPSLVSPNALL
jgi:hypothetical protein